MRIIFMLVLSLVTLPAFAGTVKIKDAKVTAVKSDLHLESITLVSQKLGVLNLRICTPMSISGGLRMHIGDMLGTAQFAILNQLPVEVVIEFPGERSERSCIKSIIAEAN